MFSSLKKKILPILILLLISITAFSACSKVDFKVSFIVDGDVVATVSTNGSETVKMPADPQKEGYIFDGWYWDKDTWNRPFTANSLLDAPLSENMSVYAKWKALQQISVLTSPANLQINGVTLTWDVVENATAYSIDIDGELYQSDTNSFDLSELTAPQIYSIKVMAKGNGIIYLDSSWSAVKSFTVSAVLANPGNLQINGVTLTWDAVENATAYSIDIDGELYQSNTNSFDLSVLIAPKIYSIKIMAKGNGTIYLDSSWSAVKSFTVSAVLANPGNLQINGTSLTWNSVENAADYSIDIDGQLYQSDTNSFDLSGLTMPKVYLIKVMAKGNDTIYLDSSWSAVKPFTVSAVLATPGNLQINDTNLTWNAIENAADYSIDIDGQLYQSDTNSFDLSELTAPKIYSIKIMAKGNGTIYLDSSWSAAKPFTVSAVLATPKNLQINQYTLTWDAVPNSIGYMIVIDGGAPINNGALSSYSLSALTLPKNYEISVQAIGDGTVFNNSEFSVAVQYFGDDGHSIKRAEGFAMTGNNAFCKVSNSTETFSFIGKIEVSPKATWTVSTDINGVNIIPTKTINLNIGDNKVYILVTAENGIDVSLYTLTVRRRPLYTVSFDTEGGTTIYAQTIEEDSVALIPDEPIKAGYVFDKWLNNGTEYDFDTPVTSNMNIKANWKANNYTVKFDANKPVNAPTDVTGSIEDLQCTYNTTVALSLNSYSLTGYSFAGWTINADGSGTIYSNGQNISNLTTIPNDTVKFYAKWNINSYNVTLNRNITVAGTVNGSGSKAYNSSVTITATTNEGYTWLGWYDGETPLTTDLSYTFIMLAENKTYEARWKANEYTIVFESNKPVNASTDVEGSMQDLQCTYSLSAALTSSTFSLTGYTFAGWTKNADGSGTSYSNGQNISNLTTIANDTVRLYAKWNINSYTITLNRNITAGGTVNGAGTKVYNSNVTITATANAGYTWQGWYDGETEITTDLSYTFTMPAENETYEAKWLANEATISFNNNGGEGLMSGGSITTGDPLSPNTFTKTGYTFIGWSLTSEGDVVYSNEAPFTVIVDGATYTLYAQWTQLYERSGNYIWFGEYPQTIKANDVTVGTTTDSRGYYIGNDGSYYAKVNATPYDSGYKFSSDATVTSGTTYYFKVEPIKWRILEESNGTAFILAELIIDNHRYAASSNNYMNSEIRAWLNNEFYNTAFNSLQQALILTTNVDNSAASTGTVPNHYACANKNDKVFLLSYAEATNTSYGFIGGTGDTARERITSDYSRSKGAYMRTTAGTQYGNGNWWLRSPLNLDSSYARYVDLGGNINNYYVSRTTNGVVPALKIQL